MAYAISSLTDSRSADRIHYGVLSTRLCRTWRLQLPLEWTEEPIKWALLETRDLKPRTHVAAAETVDAQAPCFLPTCTCLHPLIVDFNAPHRRRTLASSAKLKDIDGVSTLGQMSITLWMNHVAQAVTQPSVQYEMTTGGERVSFTTHASKIPSGKNANFAERKVRAVLLPDDPLFAPQLSIKVQFTC